MRAFSDSQLEVLHLNKTNLDEVCQTKMKLNYIDKLQKVSVVTAVDRTY